MPAPTVVPATNAALPMTVPGASSASAAASFGLENRCGRGGAVKGFAGFGTAVRSQSQMLRIVSNSNHTSGLATVTVVGNALAKRSID